MTRVHCQYIYIRGTSAGLRRNLRGGGEGSRGRGCKLLWECAKLDVNFGEVAISDKFSKMTTAETVPLVHRRQNEVITRDVRGSSSQLPPTKQRRGVLSNLFFILSASKQFNSTRKVPCSD